MSHRKFEADVRWENRVHYSPRIPPGATWRQRAAAWIQSLVAEAHAKGLEGLAVRAYVRDQSPGLRFGHYPLKMWRQEFAREFKGKRFPGRGERAIKPAAGQGELFE